MNRLRSRLKSRLKTTMPEGNPGQGECPTLHKFRLTKKTTLHDEILRILVLHSQETDKEGNNSQYRHDFTSAGTVNPGEICSIVAKSVARQLM